MTLVPALTPVTNPVLLTVATPGVADTQGLTAAGVPDPVNCVVAPIQAIGVPVIVGNGLIVTVMVRIRRAPTLTLVREAAALDADKRHVLLTVATPGVADTQGLA